MANLGNTTIGRASARALAVFLAAFALVIALPGMARADEGAVPLAGGNAVMAIQAAPEIISPESLWPQGKNVVDYLDNYVYGMPESAVISKVRSSNPKVFKITKSGKGKKLADYTPAALKAGASKLSVTYTYKGKTSTISGTITVKPYPTVFKSIKVGKKSVPLPTAKNRTEYHGLYEMPVGSTPVKVTPAKGWDISSISVSQSRFTAMEPDYSTDIANGKSFKLRKGHFAEVYINMSNDDGGWYSFTVFVTSDKPLALMKDTFFVGQPKTLMPSYTTAADVKILKVKSSKPKVMKAVKGKTYDKIRLKPLKAGKSTLKITYKFRGKKYTTKATYAIVDNPMKALKLNGKKIKLSAGYPSGYRFYYKKWKKNTAKLVVKPSKGWSVKSMTYNYNYGKAKKLENGAAFKTPKRKFTMVDVALKSDAGKTFKFTVTLDRES